ncbi:MAG: Crp/Fnr family transcriptional regulator [Flavobacteriales bacterium]|nr:Crp/Fnr family transcriptional regulator [Flavobacteriales bacterium]
MNCLVKRDSLLDELSFEELEILESRRHPIFYEKGETIFKEGSVPGNYLCLSSGKVKIVKQIKEGKTKIIDLKKPVESLGFQSLISKSEYDYSAIAIENSQVCSIHKDDFFKVVEKNPKLSLKIIEYLNQLLDKSTNKFLIYSSKNMGSKMSYLLLLLKDFFGVDEENKLLVKLSRKEIADLSDMDISNAIRTLSNLASKNLIKLDNKDIYLENLEALKLLSEKK